MCVVSRSSTGCRDLKNALLYADAVNWLPTQTIGFAIQDLAGSLLEDPIGGDVELDNPGSSLSLTAILRDPEVLEMKEQHHEFIRELAQTGLDKTVEVSLIPADFIQSVAATADFGRSFEAAVTRGMAGCRVLYRHGGSPTISNTSNWDAYAATGHLTNAMSKLLLPEVSSLPLEAIAEMRDRRADALDPMRAELLRFTEDLRRLIGDKPPTVAQLESEAQNLVATRIESVVREAGRRARELADKKWRKLFASAAAAFGLTGATFVDPKLLAKAIQKTLEVGALAFGDPENDQPRVTGAATAQFVLEARTIMGKAWPDR